MTSVIIDYLTIHLNIRTSNLSLKCNVHTMLKRYQTQRLTCTPFEYIINNEVRIQVHVYFTFPLQIISKVNTSVNINTHGITSYTFIHAQSTLG